MELEMERVEVGKWRGRENRDAKIAFVRRRDVVVVIAGRLWPALD